MCDSPGETVHLHGYGGSKILNKERDQRCRQQLENVAIELAPVATQ